MPSSQWPRSLLTGEHHARMAVKSLLLLCCVSSTVLPVWCPIVTGHLLSGESCLIVLLLLLSLCEALQLTLLSLACLPCRCCSQL